jgi:hypothetical protein
MVATHLFFDWCLTFCEKLQHNTNQAEEKLETHWDNISIRFAASIDPMLPSHHMNAWALHC